MILQPGQFDASTSGGMWTQEGPASARGSAVTNDGRNPRVRMRLSTVDPESYSQHTYVSPSPGVVGFRGAHWSAEMEGSPFAMRQGHASTPIRARIAAESMARRMSEGRDLGTGRPHTPPPGQSHESWAYGW